MTAIPRDLLPDATLALWRDPYGFIAKRCRRHGADLFATRLGLRDAVCMTGRDAAMLFYDAERFQRAGVAPVRIERTLFGRGGVQGLDGDDHRRRKALFLSLLAEERVAALADRAQESLLEQAGRWVGRGRVALYPELQQALCRAVCAWAGVPLAAEALVPRSEQIAATFDGAGAVGPRHWRARRARAQLEAWLGEEIRARRARPGPVPSDAVHAIARYRDARRALLPERVAAVELLNLLRPTVAVSVYLVFVALAWHEHPKALAPLAASPEGAVDPDLAFVEEVRRLQPFFPFVGALVRRDFTWRGYRFERGRRVLLDLYGTNRDPRLWQDPERFRPERFARRAADPFAPIPQGGGDVASGHRCPGEPVALALMRRWLGVFTEHLRYRVPEQDLRIDRSRLPALPRSRFVIEDVGFVTSPRPAARRTPTAGSARRSGARRPG